MDKIALIVAMQQEANPIIKKLGLLEQPDILSKKFSDKLPMKVYQKDNVSLILNGMCKKNNVDRVGTQAAALSTFICAEVIRPDLIISLGTAGAASNQDFKIGEVVVGKKLFLYHDRRIPLPKFQEYGLGSYLVFAKAELIAKRLKLKQSVIASGNSLINTAEDYQILMEHKAYIKEMEVASIAEVALYYDIPVMAVKAITDFYDDPEQSAAQFVKNFQLAVENLSAIIQHLLSETAKH